MVRFTVIWVGRRPCRAEVIWKEPANSTNILQKQYGLRDQWLRTFNFKLDFLSTMLPLVEVPPDFKCNALAYRGCVRACTQLN